MGDNALIKYSCHCVFKAKWVRPAEQIQARIVLTSQGEISLIFLVCLLEASDNEIGLKKCHSEKNRFADCGEL